MSLYAIHGDKRDIAQSLLGNSDVTMYSLAGEAASSDSAIADQNRRVRTHEPKIGECLLIVTKQSSERKTQMSAQSPERTLESLAV